MVLTSTVGQRRELKDSSAPPRVLTWLWLGLRLRRFFTSEPGAEEESASVLISRLLRKLAAIQHLSKNNNSALPAGTATLRCCSSFSDCGNNGQCFLKLQNPGWTCKLIRLRCSSPMWVSNHNIFIFFPQAWSGTSGTCCSQKQELHDCFGPPE